MEQLIKDRILQTVAAYEKVDVCTVILAGFYCSVSASEGVMPDVNVQIRFTKGKYTEGWYTMRWDARKEKIVKIVWMKHKCRNYTVCNQLSVFDPIQQKVNADYIDFAIAHLLRELGFRKQTRQYFVKAKGEKPKLFDSRHGGGYHYTDYNAYNKYLPHMGKARMFNDISLTPAFQEYDKAGYVCAAPSVSQISDFCEKMGMGIVIETRIDGCRAACYDKQKVLKELIKEYRRRTGFTDAFRRYAHDI